MDSNPGGQAHGPDAYDAVAPSWVGQWGAEVQVAQMLYELPRSFTEAVLVEALLARSFQRHINVLLASPESSDLWDTAVELTLQLEAYAAAQWSSGSLAAHRGGSPPWPSHGIGRTFLRDARFEGWEDLRDVCQRLEKSLSGKQLLLVRKRSILALGYQRLDFILSKGHPSPAAIIRMAESTALSSTAFERLPSAPASVRDAVPKALAKHESARASAVDDFAAAKQETVLVVDIANVLTGAYLKLAALLVEAYASSPDLRPKRTEAVIAQIDRILLFFDDETIFPFPWGKAYLQLDDNINLASISHLMETATASRTVSNLFEGQQGPVWQGIYAQGQEARVMPRKFSNLRFIGANHELFNTSFDRFLSTSLPAIREHHPYVVVLRAARADLIRFGLDSEAALPGAAEIWQELQELFSPEVIERIKKALLTIGKDVAMVTATTTTATGSHSATDIARTAATVALVSLLFELASFGEEPKHGSRPPQDS